MALEPSSSLSTLFFCFYLNFFLIADCVLLFSLDKDQAFPVDTHIYNVNVAVKYYMPELRGKSLTPKVYQRIVDFFQEKFGEFAGWAQEYLYYDDLYKCHL